MAVRVDCTDEGQRNLYDTNTVEECCDYMKENGQDALGCEVDMSVNDPFDEQEGDDLNVKTNLIYNDLYSKNEYKSFTLKKYRLEDLAGWCQHQGWNQGDLDSDCFLDSILFAFFGNNNLSTDLSILLDNIYHDPPNSNLRKIAYIMALYAEYLKVGEKYVGGQLDTSNVVVSDINIKFKQAMKWCLIWYSIMEFKTYHDNSSPLYELLILKLVDATKVDDFDIDGSEPLVLLKIFSIIFERYDRSEIFKIAEPRKDESGTDESVYTNKDNIDNIINYNLDIYNNIVIIPYYGPLPDLPRVGRLNNLFNNPIASFEAIIQGNKKHVIAYTKCNDKWLLYNNMVNPTTVTWENSIDARVAIVNSMREAPEIGSNILIMKKRKHLGRVAPARRPKRRPRTRRRRARREVDVARGGYRKRKSKRKKSRKYTKKIRKSKKNTKRKNRRNRTKRK